MLKEAWSFTFAEQSNLNVIGKILIGPFAFILIVLCLCYAKTFSFLFEKKN